MKKTIYTLLYVAITLGFAGCERNDSCNQTDDSATIIEFIDSSFKAALLDTVRNHTPAQIDTNNDGEISYGEAAKVTDMDVNSYRLINHIDTMPEIKYFTALTKLDCSNNHLGELDVTSNSNLIVLDCSDNSIKELDLSKNSELRELNCFYNFLRGTIDLSNNTKLTHLICSFNLLTSLNLENNTELVELNCWDNSFSELDITKNNKLGYDKQSGEYVNNLIRCGKQVNNGDITVNLIMTQAQKDRGIFDPNIANDVNEGVVVTVK